MGPGRAAGQYWSNGPPEVVLTIADPARTADEMRFVLTGRSSRDRLLVVVHAEWDEDEIRLSSARLASRRERRSGVRGKYAKSYAKGVKVAVADCDADAVPPRRPAPTTRAIEPED